MAKVASGLRGHPALVVEPHPALLAAIVVPIEAS